MAFFILQTNVCGRTSRENIFSVSVNASLKFVSSKDGHQTHYASRSTICVNASSTMHESIYCGIMRLNV